MSASIIVGLSLFSQVFVHITKKPNDRRATGKLVKGWIRPMSESLFIQCQHLLVFPAGPSAEWGVKGAAFLLRSVTHWLWLEEFSMATQSRTQPAQLLSPGSESLGSCAQQWWKGKCWWWVECEWVQKCLLDLKSCWTSSGLLLDATLTIFCSTLSYSASIFGPTDLLSTITKHLPFKSRAKGYLEQVQTSTIF